MQLSSTEPSPASGGLEMWSINAPKNSLSANDGCESEDKYSSFLAPGATKESNPEARILSCLLVLQQDSAPVDLSVNMLDHTPM